MLQLPHYIKKGQVRAMETEQASASTHKQRNQSPIMASMNHHKGIELFQAQAHLYRHIYSFLTSMSLKWAVQLEIPNIIHNHGQPMTLPELVSALKVPPSKATCVHRLMRLLTHDGFFAIIKNNGNKKEQEAYVLTPISELLVKGTDHCLSSMVQYVLDPVTLDACHNLGKWMQGEEATLAETTYGTSYYEFLTKNPAFFSVFNEAMACDSQMVNFALRDCKQVFGGLSSIVDVGGGTGTTAKILSEAFPNLKCTVFDLPQVVADLTGSKNLNFVGGDMFKSIPQADAVLLKMVLHNWSDHDCINILSKCKEAISCKGKRGKVIIIDIVINEKKEERELTEIKLSYDVVMATSLNGKERTEKEWKRLFLDAGFKDFKILPVFGIKSLIEISV